MNIIRYLVIVMLALMTAPGRAWDAVPQKIADGVYAFIGEAGPRTTANEGMNANTGFVVTAAGVVVIDSGSSKQAAQKIEAAIRRITDQPIKYVINTGGQDHRWLGNSHFADQGIPVLANERTAADIADRGGMLFESLASQLGPDFAGTRIQKPTRSFAGRQTLTLADEVIELVFAGGGHTPGDIIVWLPKKRIAFAGDIVYVDRLLGVLQVSSVKHWLNSFDALAALQPVLIVPGHGAPATLDKARRETRDYLARLQAHMKQAVDRGDDMQTAIGTLDDRDFAYLPVYQELRGQNANRSYLEAEAE
jgi:glyoxylase-like metal-dependent hydrolase (beta-lactamase superfamily II)